MERLKESLNLSCLTLGTMRWANKSLSSVQVLNLIDQCFEHGINTHHSSFEYDSYELYTKTLVKSKNKGQIKHIVKLSSPHFEEDNFSSKILKTRIENQLKSLNIESIDVLQWLVRSNPINDFDRLNILDTQKDEINNCLFNLKKEGKVKSIFSFPYSMPFVERVIKMKEIDGIISYLNTEETEYSQFANNFPFIAIRPFGGGKLLNDAKSNKSIKEHLDYVSAHKSVLTQVVSINSVEHLKELIF